MNYFFMTDNNDKYMTSLNKEEIVKFLSQRKIFIPDVTMTDEVIKRLIMAGIVWNGEIPTKGKILRYIAIDTANKVSDLSTYHEYRMSTNIELPFERFMEATSYTEVKPKKKKLHQVLWKRKETKEKSL